MTEIDKSNFEPVHSQLIDIAEKENLTVLSKHKNSTNNINFVYKKYFWV